VGANGGHDPVIRGGAFFASVRGGPVATEGNEPSVLGNWFRDWQQPLRRFLARRRAGSSADIDDIAQEVFLRLLRYDRSALIDYPQAYLFKIASNVSAEWAMRSSRRMPHQSEWLTELVDALSPEIELERAALDEQLHAAVNALPPRPREILRLHFGEGVPHEEIARRLGVTRKIVKRDIARAYGLLRVSLDITAVGKSRRQETAKTI
jgi:RNA polymerase sigma factor (sigma-70 family)